MNIMFSSFGFTVMIKIIGTEKRILPCLCHIFRCNAYFLIR